MITLATLKDASLQEIFEQAARHLLTQNEKSESGAMCVYRTHSGDGKLMCAVGCFISDEEYNKSFENCSFTAIVNRLNIKSTFAQNELLRSLQRMHDCNEPVFWRNNLFNIGLRNGLSVAFIEKEFPIEATL
jgi:hypothetical protein